MLKAENAIMNPQIPSFQMALSLPSHTSNVDAWEREYREIHGIPSSTRTLPSKALRLMEPYLDLRRNQSVFDSGCGNGRNSVYLASLGCHVVAADYSPTALRATSELASNTGVSKYVTSRQVDLLKNIPFNNNAFDLCLDSYVSCHFIEDSEFKKYWLELLRITRPGGHIFSSVLSADDDYYAPIAAKDGTYPFVTDPLNGITKKLYDDANFKSIFSSPIEITHFAKFQFQDLVSGQSYWRSLLIVVARKYPQILGRGDANA